MFGNGPAAFGGRTPTTVWLGAALGTSTVASPARVACSRTTATTTSGFVAPGRKVLCIDYPWRMIPVWSPSLPPRSPPPKPRLPPPYILSPIPCTELHDKVKQRLAPLSRIDSYGFPTYRHGRYFFSRRLANENRGSICIRTGLDGKDEVLVNPADIGKDETTTVFLAGVTRDGKLLTYGIRHGGEDEEEYRILNLETRQLLADSLPRARYFGMSIKEDQSGFFY